MNTENLHAIFDDRGLLRAGALEAPIRSQCYAVFAQRHDARIFLPELQQHAERFFRTKIGLSLEKRYADAPPEVDAAYVVVADGATLQGMRLVYARPAFEADFAAADAADSHAGYTGLASLARKCRYVWLVDAACDDAKHDRPALLIAALFASVMLGPILVPEAIGTRLIGVRTARTELER